MTKVLICRIALMSYYQDDDNDIAKGGGSYVTDGNPAHERFNFKDREDEFIKGFVESGSKTGGVNLAKIDTTIQKNADSVDDVLVIFVAKGCIIGYYKKATVYASIQDPENYDKNAFTAYNIRVKKSQAVLLSADSRNYEIPKGKGGMGQSNVFYLYDDKGELKQDEWIQKAINYVQINKLVKSYIPDIVDYCQKNPNELDNLTSQNFGNTSYPLLRSVEQIQEYDENITNPNQTLNFRYWQNTYLINNTNYRFHSQWGGHGIWNGNNNSISLDEKHRESFLQYLKEKGIDKNHNVQQTRRDSMEEIKLLKHKKQIILQGPPGTGKTRRAKKIAKLLIREKFELESKELKYADFEKIELEEHKDTDFSDYVYEGLIIPINNQDNIKIISIGEKENRPAIIFKKTKYEKEEGHIFLENIINNDTDRINGKKHNYIYTYKAFSRFISFQKQKLEQKLEQEIELKQKLIQFHPAYSYEDFVRGIVATTTDGKVGYEVQNKVLAEMAENACNNPGHNFVLIIDEINRANLAAVLGELIYALEYRGEAVESMYAKDGDRKITLPENLYIIGTMNTADRSVGYIDYAIRRRFAFVDIPANKGIIKDIDKDKDKAEAEVKAKVEAAEKLFDKVEKLFNTKEKGGFLSEEFDKNDVMIGHSYFLNDNLKLALEYEIKPILREYVKDGILTCKKDEKGKDEIDKLKC